MSQKPNILLIITDQQHHHMMSCAGNPWVDTPAIDKLAAGGTRFDRAYCSNPVCVPSRFSMFTGRMPSAINMRGNGGPNLTRFSEEEIQMTLGHLVAGAGYNCVYGGKEHFPIELNAERMGFHYFCKDECEELAEQSAKFIQKSHDKPWFLVSSLINPHDICYQAIRDFAETEGEQWLIKNGKREITALDKALQIPKGISEEKFFEEYCPPLPDNFDIQSDEPSAINDILHERPFKIKAREQWTEKNWRLHRWAYARLTEQVDSEIGTILEALEKSGQVENTLVIFTADHGDHDASHHLEHKTFFYEEAAAVPFIMRLPGQIKAGRLDESHMIETGLDLMATICDYAGVEQPTHNTGSSIRELAKNGDAYNDEGAFEGAYAENCISYMWVTERYKYVRYDFGENTEQLYDLEIDPGETKNVITDNPDIAAALSKRLDQEIEKHSGLRLAYI